MNKKNKLIFAFTLPSFLLLSSFSFKEDCYEKQIEIIENETILSTNQTIQTKKINIENEEPDLSIFKVAESEYAVHMSNKNICEDKLTWYLEYKELVETYSFVLDAKETIYDCFTEKELQNLFGVVEAEVGGLGGFEERVNVASVIFNRLNDERFGDTLNKILTADQFSTISNGSYKKVTPTEETVLACEYAFIIGDSTNGAIYFEGKNSYVHNAYATFLFQDNSGHKFYQ